MAAGVSATRRTRTVMGTVDRALRLLHHFSVESPEWRLSELARGSGYDKTTTLRLMTALERNGFVEQEPVSRKYRLGVAPINLARIREQSFPLQTLVQPMLNHLADEFGETAHASLLVGGGLMNVATAEPRRAARVFVDPSIPLPIHASASGLAVLAFTSPQDRELLGLSEDLQEFTKYTARSDAELAPMLDRIVEQGFSRADRTYDIDVIGTAVPVFDRSDRPVGTIAVAAFATRFDDVLGRRIAQALMEAGRDLSRQMGRTAGIPDEQGSPDK